MSDPDEVVVLDARRSRGRTTSSSDARISASAVESSYLQGFCEELAWIQAVNEDTVNDSLTVMYSDQ